MIKRNEIFRVKHMKVFKVTREFPYKEHYIVLDTRSNREERFENRTEAIAMAKNIAYPYQRRI